jgi:Tol biopolymer transport system component
MKMNILLVPLLMISIATAQLKTLSIENVPLPATEVWSHAVFSPSGNEIFLTNHDYNGIWQYSLDTKLLKEITRDAQSGFAFSVSVDGNSLAYRRTVQTSDPRMRIQESVELSLTSGSKQVIERGNSVSTPVFVNNRAVADKKNFQKISSAVAPVVLGIDETKISLLINGEKKNFDPLNGQYIWPVLSPVKNEIVFVEMDRGAFVCSLDGTNLRWLGKCDAPTWTRDGKWIIGMDDRDDGQTIQSSSIIAVSPDGREQYNLTEGFAGLAMYPSCSPVENNIVFTTADGKVYLLTYEEVK